LRIEPRQARVARVSASVSAIVILGAIVLAL
jgi:hypothetical protein